MNSLLKLIDFETLTIKTVWSDWVKGSCSATCGAGTVSFTRKCLNEPCVGESTRVEKCEEKVCPGMNIYFSLLIKFL